MNTILKKWVEDNSAKILELRLWRSIIAFIKAETGETPNAREIYEICFPEKVMSCDASRFISFSVGFRSCAKNCKCYTAMVSASVTAAKSKYTDEQKAQIHNKRVMTTLEKHGVKNVFELPEVADQAVITKLAKYGSSTYNNRDQSKQTTLSRYGVENVMQVTEIYNKNVEHRDYATSGQKSKDTKIERYGVAWNNHEKTVQTNLLKYGVDNPAKSEVIADKISTKLREHFISRHSTKYNITPTFAVAEYVPGSENAWVCNECKNTINGIARNGGFTRCYFCHPSGSAAEREVKDFIINLGCSVVSNSRKIIAPKELDIYIPEKKLAIEYCGIYWHREQQGKQSDYHVSKLTMCAQNDIRLITLFSNHWILRPEIVKSKLRHLLGIPGRKIYARTCAVKEVSSSDSALFLAGNHLQGACTASTRLGLYLNNELVALMTFSTSRFERNKKELVRFATLLDTAVVGAASKLLAHYIKMASPHTLVSYSDNTWGYSSFYETLGFTKVSSGIPGYYYANVKKGLPELFNRMRYQKHKLLNLGFTVDTAKTEYCNMLDNGFDRVWDCGQSKDELVIG